MEKKDIIRNVALMAIFLGIGLSQFTQGVRTVQILGLFASGVGFGSSMTVIIQIIKSKMAKTDA